MRARYCLAVALVVAARADDGPKYRAANMEFVAHVPAGAVVADLWVHRGYAFLGSRGCGQSVSIVDATAPASARLIGQLAADSQSRYEDVVVLSADTGQFRGDLLAVGVQPCTSNGKRGVQLWDVSDPANPVELAFHQTGRRGSVHELHALQVGEHVFLYLAVPYSERYGEGGDFRIVDATNPRQPFQVSDWGVYSRLGLTESELRVLGTPDVLCHSVTVSEDGRYAFLSYWDAGYITLDIGDPAQPVFLSRTEYNWPDEGNAHSVFPVMSRHLLLAADEDFQIGGVQVEIGAAETSLVSSSELPFARAACSAEPVRTEVVFAGEGCSGLPDLSGRIAAFESGGCSYYEKALAAQRAGAAGFLIAQSVDANIGSGEEAIAIPGAAISEAEFHRARNSGRVARARIGAPPDNSWGYIRIFDIADLSSPRQIGSFATENARRCPAAPGGWFTVHNPVVAGDIAYFSWYSDGVRAVNIADPENPVEIGSFVIEAHAEEHAAAKDGGRRSSDAGHAELEGEPFTFVWGVFVHDGLVYLSDEMTGLWIVRLKEAPEAREDQKGSFGQRRSSPYTRARSRR